MYFERVGHCPFSGLQRWLKAILPSTGIYSFPFPHDF